MKNLQRFVMLSLIYVCLFACKEKADDPKAQDPNDNEFISVMRDMNTKIDSVKMTAHADVDFAAMMEVHHQAAIDMADRELQHGDDATIKAIAQKLKDRQTAERDFFKTWLVDRHPTPNAEGQQLDDEMHAAMKRMKEKQDAQSVTGDADIDFAALMVIHHQAAIESAETEVRLGHHDEVKDIARKIMEDQTAENDQLNSWLRDNGKGSN